MVAYVRTRIIRLLVYLDDILIIGSSVQILREHTFLVIDLLQNLSKTNAPQTATSRLDHFQQLCTTAGFSNTVTCLLSSATCQSSDKSYDCAWTKWNSWCNRRKVNPISATVKDILTFLSDQFDNNSQLSYCKRVPLSYIIYTPLD